MTNPNPLLANLQPFVDQLKRNIQHYKSLESQVAAVDGDKETAIKAWMQSSDDEEAANLRGLIERATAKLKELAIANLSDSQLSDAEKARLRSEFETVTKKVKAASRGLRAMADPFGLDVTPLLEEVGDPFLPKTPTGTGTGTPRPSVYVKIQKDGDPEQTFSFETLSAAAKHLENSGMDVEQLGKLYAQAAGVAYEEIAKVKEITTFTWHNETLANSPTWEITLTPKDNTRGRQKVSAKDRVNGRGGETIENSAPPVNEEAVA